MSNEMVPFDGDIAVTALHPIQMQESQEKLIQWCEGKINAVSAEAIELEEAYQHARAHAWKASTLKKHANLAVKRRDYFIKIREALMAGYYIVPNFPIQMFVIKTKKNQPKYQRKTDAYYIKSAEADALPLGTGEYRNNNVLIETHYKWDNEKKTHTYSHVTAKEFAEIEFPINMAKPQIMDATAEAMKKKIFDQIGVLPNFRKKQDPLIIGQIINGDKIVSFMIAWHLNTDVL